MAWVLTALVAVALITGLTLLVVALARELISNRRLVREMQRQGKPTAPHSFLFGSIRYMKTVFARFPFQSHASYAMAHVVRENSRSGACYLDMWPGLPPTLLIANTHMAHQVAAYPAVSHMKLFNSYEHFHMITSPAFTPDFIAAMTPVLVGSARKFVDRLQDRAEGSQRFALEPLARDFVIDIAGPILLSLDLDMQGDGNSQLKRTIQEIIELEAQTSKPPGLRFFTSRASNSIRLTALSQELRHHIETHVLTRYTTLYAAKIRESQAPAPFASVLDTVIGNSLIGRAKPPSPPPSFLALQTRYMSTFFSGGYSSAASILTYALYTTHSRPGVLAALRAECDAVLGPDPAAALLADPSLLDKLPYTTACVRETLRLFPPPGPARPGATDLVLRDEDGMVFPTAGFEVQLLNGALGRDEEFYPRAGEFLPERWLVPEGDELRVRDGAWIAMEERQSWSGWGVVVQAAKVVLVMAAREVTVEERYGDVDREMGREGVCVDGERAWSVDGEGGRVVDGFPCVVRRRK